MTSDESETTIAAVQLDDKFSFTLENPMGADVLVTARDQNGNEQIFGVETTDGRYHPELGCHIVAQPSGQQFDQPVKQPDVPDFDLDTIVDAAENVMDTKITLEDTGHKTQNGNKLFLAINPDNVHIVEQIKVTNDPQLSQVGQLFDTSLWCCNTAEEARKFVKERYGQ